MEIIRASLWMVAGKSCQWPLEPWFFFWSCRQDLSGSEGMLVSLGLSEILKDNVWLEWHFYQDCLGKVWGFLVLEPLCPGGHDWIFMVPISLRIFDEVEDIMSVGAKLNVARFAGVLGAKSVAIDGYPYLWNSRFRDLIVFFSLPWDFFHIHLKCNAMYIIISALSHFHIHVLSLWINLLQNDHKYSVLFPCGDLQNLFLWIFPLLSNF